MSLLSIAGAGYAGFNAGGDYVRAQMSEGIERERRNQAEKVESLIELTKAKKVIYRDKIRYIKTATDPTGCLDTTIPADILSKLR